MVLLETNPQFWEKYQPVPGALKHSCSTLQNISWRPWVYSVIYHHTTKDNYICCYMYPVSWLCKYINLCWADYGPTVTKRTITSGVICTQQVDSGDDSGRGRTRRAPPKKWKKYDFFGVKSWFFTRNTPNIFAPSSAIGKNMIFGRKIVTFHTKYPNTFSASLRSAQFV